MTVYVEGYNISNAERFKSLNSIIFELGTMK